MFRVAWPVVFSLLLVARAGLLSAAPFTYVLNGSSDDLSVVDLAASATIEGDFR